jgi:perosamine synthetase
VSVAQRVWPWYSDDALQGVQDRLRSGQNLGAQGPDEAVEELEFRAREALAPPGHHTLSFGSGSSALFAAYRALGLEGAEVLVPTYTFRATVTALIAAGGRPVFYDARPDTGEADLDRIPRDALERASALVVTHMHGLVGSVSSFAALADRFGLHLVEDCSHAHGAIDEDGSRPGTGAVASVYSLGTTKLATGGLGGVAFFRDENAYHAAILAGQAKWRTSRDVPHHPLAGVGGGFHHRMSPVSAILASDHLRRLEQILCDKEIAVGQFLGRMEASRAPLTPVRPRGGRHQGLYKIHVKVDAAAPRDEVLAQFRAHGLRVRRPLRPLHLEPALSSLPRATDLSGVERYLEDIVEFDALDLHDPSATDGVLEALDGALAAA